MFQLTSNFASISGRLESVAMDRGEHVADDLVARALDERRGEFVFRREQARDVRGVGALNQTQRGLQQVAKPALDNRLSPPREGLWTTTVAASAVISDAYFVPRFRRLWMQVALQLHAP
jgi:hypothetical protein